MSTRKIRRGRPSKSSAIVAPIVLLCVLAVAGCSSSSKHQSTLDPKGKVARDDFHIFNAFFWVAAVIGVLVIAGVVFAAIRFRERPGNENPVQVHGNTTLEISWTIAPALILMVMAVFTVKLIWQQVEHPKNAVEITVTGKQWWWEFQYTNVDAKHQVITANELHIPQGRPVFLTLKSDNVIHSFWMPPLTGKRDVVPGRYNHIAFESDKNLATDGKPVTYYGQCAEYCGLSHADMRNVVIVETQHDFDNWYKSQLEPWSAEQVATFKKWDSVYSCTSCHYIQGADPKADANIQAGKSAAVNIGPNLTHLADRNTFGGATFELTTENLWQWIYDAPRHGTDDAIGKYNSCPHKGNGGKTGAGTPCKVGMPSFRDDPDHPMTEDTARAIADFLMSTKNLEGQ